MKRTLLSALFALAFPLLIFAQHSEQGRSIEQLKMFEDTLKGLGNSFINAPEDMDRIEDNARFIKTLKSALKVPNSFLYRFDSLKTISILNSPDNRFRIFSWHIIYLDGSYRFFGAIQMNTGGALKLYPLTDYSPFLKNPEDSVTDGHKWYGAQYYKIVRVEASTPYYTLLGWKGNTVRSTKKVIEALSFKTTGPQFGMSVFDDKGKSKKRVIFEYSREASMLLQFTPDQHTIVFDNLEPPDKKLKGKFQSYGPDLSYNAYRLRSNGHWEYADNVDMRNVPSIHDVDYIDPRTDGGTKPIKKTP